MTVTLDSAAVAQYLADHPRFFEEHAGLLGEVKLSSPLTGKAVSLQERQMEVMRAKYNALELRLAELMRTAADNTVILNRFHAWHLALLKSAGGAAMARDLVDGLITHFGVPQATLRLWNVGAEHADSWFANNVAEDARLFASSLRAPYCGPNKDFEAVRWLDDADNVRSTVLLPLTSEGATFGLLVMGSPDVARFSPMMATDFLVQLGQSASAALAPLRA
ncbi:DUF484 family protein [Massilia sp. Leaf139]|uniref:DUF484 family protein n=1 Tax=Massilia sp. Leaf139 TaxID=1736272 RepID=UPI0006FFE849|nr:DUF484 family protein [Massilia sp. Leaf139]KQQ87116.1 hypothetical protein ASF77_16045 [Massilia sp. Leaf139]